MTLKRAKLNKRIVQSPVVVITGAGASVPFGLHTTYSFRDMIERQEWFQSEYGPNLYEVVSSLDDTKDVDIERVLDFMQECLDHYDALQKSPEFNRYFKVAGGVPVPKNFRGRRERILDEMVSHYAQVDSGQAARVYSSFLTALRDLFSVSTVPLFTLNYDVAVEVAAETLQQTKLNDGVDTRPHEPRWDPRMFETYRPPTGKGRLGLVLFKLHCSVSWVQRSGSNAIIRLPGIPRRTQGLDHVIQYPSAAYKDLTREPFATGYRYLAECLRQTKVVLIIGCSFRDEELVNEIKAACASNPGLQLYALNPSKKVVQNAIEKGVPITTAILGEFGSEKALQLLETVVHHYKKTGEPWPQPFIDRIPP